MHTMASAATVTDSSLAVLRTTDEHDGIPEAVFFVRISHLLQYRYCYIGTANEMTGVF